MLVRTKPDAAKAGHRLRTLFPYRGDALIAALTKENAEKKVLPDWRQFQVTKFIKAVNLFCGDLNERYRARRIDALANTTRNLAEICIWTQYCNISEEKAKTFFEDSARDFKEILASLQKLYTSINGQPEDLLAEIINKFQTAAVKFGIADYDERYVQVRDAAKEVGRLEGFNTLYKIFSKLAHPTSLILAMDNTVGQSSEMLDALYVGGEEFASASLREIEKSINKAFPSLTV